MISSRTMRLGVLLVLSGCGFPDVKPGDASIPDATTDVATDAGSGDAGMDSPVTTSGCTSNSDCALGCTGVLPSCGCATYLKDGGMKPSCDSTCMATGCANKTAVCTDAGACLIQ